MKKEITIPVGKISAVAIYGTGICSNILLDNVLKKNTTGNKYIDVIARNGIEVLTSSAFIALASASWFDDSLNFDIKIPRIGKNKSKDHKQEHLIENNNKPEEDFISEIHKVSKKTTDRMKKAAKLWEEIFQAAMDTSEWINTQKSIEDLHEDLKDVEVPQFLKKKKVNELNEVMYKLANKVGFVYNEINVQDDHVAMADDILTNHSYQMTSYLREAYQYCYGSPVNGNIEPNEVVNVLNDAPEEETDNKVHATNVTEFMDNVQDIFSSKDVHLNEDQVFNLMEYANDKNINDILSEFKNGEISAVNACDKISAYLIKDETEEVEPEELVVADPMNVASEEDINAVAIETDCASFVSDLRNAGIAIDNDMANKIVSYNGHEVISEIIIDYNAGLIGSDEAFKRVKNFIKNQK